MIIFFLGAFITGVGFLMNRMNVMKYKNNGISIPAYITDMETYSQKISRKGRTREVNMLQLKFTLNGTPGSAHVSEYIGGTEMESYKDGQKVDLVYLPDSVYIANGKVSFIRPVMLKTTIEFALDRLSWYPYIGGTCLALGLILLVVPRFASKK
ncbi:MAG TPA: hypothetical protein PKL30_23755 [Leptospiraceae bacterium]|nr:hypothetical protein [Leptospiraceae bacterium]HMW08709.1 hypothetical protein [Leptospiraceae bacterium]HMX35125.1 hypothetical protein [Leptospiraceae bacterium]HMZ66840.1 hypothetical protein [Leptospiraceae bacterium]HNA10446.1 hypothetical protein [Leptospiraceae bacterium]